jgi:hypothetical protein
VVRVLIFDLLEVCVAGVNPLWDEFIVWLQTPALDREHATQAAWAAAHGLSDRAVRKWKSQPAFIARQEDMAARFSGVAREVVEAELSGGGDETDYQLVKSKLVEQAKQGNAKAVELYFRTYGKPFVEEEAASRQSDFANSDLDVLVAQALTAVGADLVAAALREQGWTVLGPEVVAVDA